jgi:hypothetical protein
MNNTLKKMDEFYTRAGASTKGTEFGSITSLFANDGVPGINLDNPLEYALFQQLYANLPRDLGMSYDYKTQTNYRAQQSLNLQKQNLYLQQKQYEKVGSLDGLLTKHIDEGKFDGTQAAALINSFLVSEDALGGIKDGSGNAIWKYWKKDYSKYENMKFSDLSENDQIECKFEIIDILHFFLNMAISIGMTPQEMFNMYMSKNQENRDRQTRGY